MPILANIPHLDPPVDYNLSLLFLFDSLLSRPIVVSSLASFALLSSFFCLLPPFFFLFVLSSSKASSSLSLSPPSNFLKEKEELIHIDSSCFVFIFKLF